MQSKSSSALMGKATQAVASARVLLDLGDEDGACNRAYYAMFDAAQAALLESGVPAPDALGKTHRGLINTFSAYLVKDGPVSKELGRQLKRAEEMRLVADYNGESVVQADAAELVLQAEAFVLAMQRLFFEDKAS
ncbi:HEPN domain-containing protein [Limnohabitans sp. Jir72]|uniref:HEPN domain-containing protein n=1 Tax=Limnohabitans sp. Jir72 TaxID=1977909 RepID=UPI000DD29EAE|nr:HEPN domain-containing protein [Limnohabitans sp. Jir72]PUE31564.1 DNA-binding protein [Limnohabitans sp. Jir72]